VPTATFVVYGAVPPTDLAPLTTGAEWRWRNGWSVMAKLRRDRQSLADLYRHRPDQIFLVIAGRGGADARHRAVSLCFFAVRERFTVMACQPPFWS
jgi:hypothetical protein